MRLWNVASVRGSCPRNHAHLDERAVRRARGLEDGAECDGEAGVAIMQHELHPRPGTLQVREQIPGLLDHPRLDRVLRSAQYPDPAGAVLDHGQDSVECSFVAVHRIRVTWESSQVRTAFDRQCLPRSDST